MFVILGENFSVFSMKHLCSPSFSFSSFTELCAALKQECVMNSAMFLFASCVKMVKNILYNLLLWE